MSSKNEPSDLVIISTIGDILNGYMDDGNRTPSSSWAKDALGEIVNLIAPRQTPKGFVRVPLDADDKPCEVGDILQRGADTFEVVAICDEHFVYLRPLGSEILVLMEAIDLHHSTGPSLYRHVAHRLHDIRCDACDDPDEITDFIYDAVMPKPHDPQADISEELIEIKNRLVELLAAAQEKDDNER